MASPNYFTCTLGQAAALSLTNPHFKNINAFIDDQAHSIPDQAAVGFAEPSQDSRDNSKPWSHSIFTFAQVRTASCALAALLHREHGDQVAQSGTVALLCPSTPEFLIVWLALTRLGHAVLLIAPQCPPPAVASLCESCDVRFIFYDGIYSHLATEAVKVSQAGTKLTAIALPLGPQLKIAELLCSHSTDNAITLSSDCQPTDVAYLHHTSGTSSGVPKPIPQTHRAGAGVLPQFPDGKDKATFTTTPLYHGGIADLFRAWTSGAMIWLFPGKSNHDTAQPITVNNVIKCLDVAADCTRHGSCPPVKYFSSVPYVLQSLEADERGLRYLRKMDVVGVGGAALPDEVGDRIVDQNINLISRFGSAECGFVMSSHRDYAKDKAWQYLRSDKGAENLNFEKQESGLVELIVLDGWPHMV